MNLQHCRALIAQGQKKEALNWLNQQPESPDILLLLALCSTNNASEHWSKAIEALEQRGVHRDLLLALGRGIAQARVDLNSTVQIQYLQRAIQTAAVLEDHVQQIHWTAILANLLLRLGNTDKALPWLRRSVQLSIEHQHHLVTIAQGTILSGLWFSRGEIDRVSALSISIEDAAILRKNWLALATARNTRASALLIRNKHYEALSLLMETGDVLFQKGAVAALNIVKARLGEIHLIIGREQTVQIIQTIQQSVQ